MAAVAFASRSALVYCLNLPFWPTEVDGERMGRVFFPIRAAFMLHFFCRFYMRYLEISALMINANLLLCSPEVTRRLTPNWGK